MTYDSTTGRVSGYSLRTVAVDMTPQADGSAPAATPGPQDDWSGADDLGWAGSGGGIGTGNDEGGFPWILAVLAGVVVVTYAVGGSDD
jgi:hypothetical protein